MGGLTTECQIILERRIVVQRLSLENHGQITIAVSPAYIIGSQMTTKMTFEFLYCHVILQKQAVGLITNEMNILCRNVSFLLKRVTVDPFPEGIQVLTFPAKTKKILDCTAFPAGLA